MVQFPLGYVWVIIHDIKTLSHINYGLCDKCACYMHAENTSSHTELKKKAKILKNWHHACSRHNQCISLWTDITSVYLSFCLLVHSCAHQPRPNDDVWRKRRSLRTLLPHQYWQDKWCTQQAILQTPVWAPQQTPGNLSWQVSTVWQVNVVYVVLRRRHKN